MIMADDGGCGLATTCHLKFGVSICSCTHLIRHHPRHLLDRVVIVRRGRRHQHLQLHLLVAGMPQGWYLPQPLFRSVDCLPHQTSSAFTQLMLPHFNLWLRRRSPLCSAFLPPDPYSLPSTACVIFQCWLHITHTHTHTHNLSHCSMVKSMEKESIQPKQKSYPSLPCHHYSSCQALLSSPCPILPEWSNPPILSDFFSFYIVHSTYSLSVISLLLFRVDNDGDVHPFLFSYSVKRLS